MTPKVWAEPRFPALSECLWYHTIDLPGIGVVEGQWDLRETIDAYLGGIDVAGKRCLDVGTASGFLTYEMERRGASAVVSMDLDPHVHEWELVPFAAHAYDIAALRHRLEETLPKVQNSYWLAHDLFKSQARVHYGTAYHLPAALGHFDIAVVGMMLPHTERPLRVLEQVAHLADRILVTQQAPQIGDAWAYLMPDPDTLNPSGAWWSISDDCLARMLKILGYEVIARVQAAHRCPLRGDSEVCTATVAERRIPRRV